MTMQFVAKLKQLWRNERGSIAQMVGLSMLAICVAIGAAIDYGRITNAQARLSAAMDAAVIQVANQKTGTIAELQTAAEAVMKKNYGTDDYDKVTGFTLSGTVGQEITAKATVTVKTWFMSLVGIKSIDIPITSQAKSDGGVNVEVAMVLDNTGSMNWVAYDDYQYPVGTEKSRLTSLKEASNSFIDTVVSTSQTPYYSKIAIAPYAANVSPGVFLNMVRPLKAGTCNRTLRGTLPVCESYGKANYDNKGNFTGYTNIVSALDCVTEREGSDYNSDADMASSPVMPEYVDSCNKATVRLLTSNISNLKATITSMTGNNGTAGHIGIQWGIQALSPNSTLNTALSGTEKTEAKPAAYDAPKTKKVMVIMTDGDFNHENCRGYDNPDYCTNANGNSLTQAAAECSAAKANNIEIYFVNFTTKTPTSAVQTMINGCSTDASHQLTASDDASLKAAFAKIAEAIQTMRLTM